jgi:Uncharacterised nucleotidyltransferase
MGSIRRAPLGPERELVLLLSGTEQRLGAHHDRVRELCNTADLDAVNSLLVELRLETVVGPRLARAAGDRLPSTVADALAKATEAQRRRALRMVAETEWLVRSLEAAGIPALPLKGVVLSGRAYGDATIRPTSDIDVLLNRDDMDRACQLLQSNGYVHGPETRRIGGLPRLHEFLSDKRGRRPIVELHWRIHWFEEQFSRDLTRYAAPSGGDPPEREEHEFLSLLLFYARDGFRGLRLASDIAAWCDRHGNHLDEDVLRRVVARHPALWRAFATAARVAHDVAGVPLLSPLSELPFDRRCRAAGRLANWSNEGGLGQRNAYVELVNFLLAPRGRRWSTLQWSLQPTTEELVAYHDLADTGRAAFLMWRLLHPVKVLGRFGLAYSDIVGGRGAHRPFPA